MTKYVIIFVVHFGPQSMSLQLWMKTSDMLCCTYKKPLSLLLNLTIRLKYMTTWNYNRTDTIPISYPVIMIRSAEAKFPPEYSDRNLTVKTQCVKKTWLSGNCRASPVASVSSKTQLAQLIQSWLQQPMQHGTVVAVFLYVLFLLYLSLSLSLIPYSPKVGISHISPWHLTVSECLEQHLWQFHWHYGL